jgi:hypothetical protein
MRGAGKSTRAHSCLLHQVVAKRRVSGSRVRSARSSHGCCWLARDRLCDAAAAFSRSRARVPCLRWPGGRAAMSARHGLHQDVYANQQALTVTDRQARLFCLSQDALVLLFEATRRSRRDDVRVRA